MPKKRKVSAVRDFPVAFQQRRGQSDSHKKTSAHHDVPDAFKQSDTDFMTLRNNAERVADILNHDPSLTVLEMVYAPGEEKALPTDSVYSGETVASVTPLAIMEASDRSEEAKDIIPLAIEEHDSSEVIRQTDAANRSKFKEDRRTGEDVYAESEFSKSVKQGRARVRACSRLNHKNTCMQRHRKVSAVRDFPVAFELMEKTGNICDFPPEKEPVTSKVSLKQEEGKSPQGQHLASTELKHGEVVLALMAASSCPWSLKKSRGSTSKEGKQSGKKRV